MNQQSLTKVIKILLFLVLTVIILVAAKTFLVPLVFALLFSTLLLPICLRLEGLGWGRGLASLVSLLLFVIITVSVVSVVVWQVSDLSKSRKEIEQRISAKMQEFREYVAQTVGISPERQDEILRNNRSASGGIVSLALAGLLSSASSFLTHLILVVVYIFLFLYYRVHLKKFILMLVRGEERRNVEKALREARMVSQKYVTGIAAMVLCLWVMYSIGFSLVGIRHAVFFAILCGLFEIVPFVGNLTGNIIAVIAVIMQDGSTAMIFGVVLTYATVQFLQTYILEPLVVGRIVSVNPLFTIAGIVAGELVWGIPGMILAIPLLGILKIFCDHFPPLHPYGFLIGQERTSNRKFLDKMKSWVK